MLSLTHIHKHILSHTPTYMFEVWKVSDLEPVGNWGFYGQMCAGGTWFGLPLQGLTYCDAWMPTENLPSPFPLGPHPTASRVLLLKLFSIGLLFPVRGLEKKRMALWKKQRESEGMLRRNKRPGNNSYRDNWDELHVMQQLTAVVHAVSDAGKVISSSPLPPFPNSTVL